MKREIAAYGAKYNLHCPRCGCDEWSEETYNTGHDKIYHKCLRCGIDVRTDRHTTFVAVPENQFLEFTEQTYDLIQEVIKNSWDKPADSISEGERDG